MSETQKLHDSNGVIRSPKKLEDTLSKMKVNEDNKDQSTPYPDRPGERDCLFFLRTGQCGYGNTCRYNHPLTPPPHGINYYYEDLPERIGQPDCEYFLKTGACKYGPTCKYHHPKDRNGAGPVLFNVLGYPIRQGEKSCPYYMQKGTCRFGVACKFHHPYPVSVNGHSSSFPSVGFPYAGGLMMMPLPTMPPQVSQPQTYMPFMVAPSQGLYPPPQVWSPYMAPSNPIYNVNFQPDLSTSAAAPMAVASHHQGSTEKAECRYYMHTGTCKYGDDCKYSHPKERNSIVLPVRPGQAACGNFMSYGFCKFGASCKFDHSMALNTYNNNTGLTLPTAYVPPVSNDLKISLSPSSSVSSGKSAAENQDSETEVDKLEEKDLSLPPSHIDSTTSQTNEEEDPCIETEKAKNSEVKDSSLIDS